MPSIQLMKHCSSCGSKTLHIQQKVGTATNLVHLILTVMTLGLWLVIWAISIPGRELTQPPQCTVCGNSSRGPSIPWADKTPSAEPKRAIAEKRIPCPFCAELIKREAKICRYCQRDLPEQEAEAAELVVKNTDPTEPEPEWEYKGIKITKRGRDYCLDEKQVGYATLKIAKMVIDRDKLGKPIHPAFRT